MELSQTQTISQGQASANLREAGAERSAALAENRRAATEQQVQQADASRTRSAQALAETREAISRALGLNTRLSITRASDASTFVYRAIDVNSGEVVQEWPEEAFVDLIRGVRSEVRASAEQGLLVDDLA
ncbi:MAG: flagellar protein FlaG [Pseudomonadota bacterium]